MRRFAVPDVAGRLFFTVWLVYVLHAGTNVDKEKDPTNVRGGINGLGAKLANVHSAEFLVETVDADTRASSATSCSVTRRALVVTFVSR